MGGYSTPRSFGSAASSGAAGGPGRRAGARGATRWLAALPFLVGCTVAAVTLNTALAPASSDHEEMRLERGPEVAPPAQSSPSHHEEITFDPSEMISV